MLSTLWMFAKGREVLKLQQLLNKNSATSKLKEDGYFGKHTYDSVRIFQRNNGLIEDGIVGFKTWQKLACLAPAMNHSLASATVSNDVAADIPNPVVTESYEEFCFPFTKLPNKSWENGGRQFGASRSGGARKHAGCDLIFPSGTPIYAVADGEVVRGPYYFYSGTYAIEIRHGNLLLRYGEIAGDSYAGGKPVKKGQLIARVGLLKSGSSMLHLEIYTNGASTASLSGGGSYKRRSDITDPAPYLNIWKNNIPTV
jgi:murein DD-endopeptidase MepM/ murein hydrolase activator NlpD